MQQFSPVSCCSPKGISLLSLSALFELKNRGRGEKKKNAHYPANAKENGKLASEGASEGEHRCLHGYATAGRIQIWGLNIHLVPR